MDLSAITKKQKIAAAVVAAFVPLSLCCCGFGAWGVVEYSSGRDKSQTHLATNDKTDLNGVKFELTGAEIGPIEYEHTNFSGITRTLASNDSFLQVRFRITNATDSEIVRYSHWNGLDVLGNPKLVDEFGNAYKAWVTFGPENKAFKSTPRLDPGKSVESFVAFELPLDKAKTLKLELSGENVGRPGRVIAYTIPISFIKKK